MTDFQSILDIIYRKSPRQKKRIEKHLAGKDRRFFKEANQFARNYSDYLESQQISVESAVDSYLNMCYEMLTYQIDFFKTGKYPVDSEHSVLNDVYMNDSQMKSYMVGLAFSQFLWDTHYRIFRFYGDYIGNNRQYFHSILEVGPGHGLFLLKTLECVQPNDTVHVVDISPTSIEIAKSVVQHFKPNHGKIEYYIDNIFNFKNNIQYDFVVIGEVLEHVKDPGQLLLLLSTLLASQGRLYVSTCVNCPAKDHLYHFRTVEEIREMIQLCGFQIQEDLALPAESVSQEELIEKRITINYCAIIGKTS